MEPQEGVDMTVIRQRVRAVDLEEADPLQEIRAAAKALYVANKAKNAAGTVERKAQAKLDELMAKYRQGRAWSTDHTFQHNDKTVTADVEYDEGEREVLDVAALAKLVDEETLLDVVTAAKGTVEKVCGKNIAAACVTTQKTDFKAKVKERK